MLLSILLQAIGGIGLTKLGAAIGAGIAVLANFFWSVALTLLIMK